MYLAYNVAERPVSKFIGDQLTRDPGLEWNGLRRLLAAEYTNEKMAVEEMRSYIKLGQMRGETPGD